MLNTLISSRFELSELVRLVFCIIWSFYADSSVDVFNITKRMHPGRKFTIETLYNYHVIACCVRCIFDDASCR